MITGEAIQVGVYLFNYVYAYLKMELYKLTKYYSIFYIFC